MEEDGEPTGAAALEARLQVLPDRGRTAELHLRPRAEQAIPGAALLADHVLRLDRGNLLKRIARLSRNTSAPSLSSCPPASLCAALPSTRHTVLRCTAYFLPTTFPCNVDVHTSRDFFPYENVCRFSEVERERERERERVRDVLEQPLDKCFFSLAPCILDSTRLFAQWVTC